MNEKVNMQNLIDVLAKKHGMTAENADEFVKDFFKLIETSLETDKYVKIRGLGTFKLITVGSRESINVNTGERFEIPNHTKVSFTPEPTLKDLINKPFSHFDTVPLNDHTVLVDTPTETASGQPDSEEEGAVEPVVAAPQPEPVLEAVEPTEPQDLSDPSKEALTDPSRETTRLDINSSQQGRSKHRKFTWRRTKTKEKKKEEQYDPVGMKIFIIIAVLVILCCAAAVLFMYYPDLLYQSTQKATPIPAQTEEVASTDIDAYADEEETLLTDSLDEEPVDTLDLIPPTPSSLSPQPPSPVGRGSDDTPTNISPLPTGKGQEEGLPAYDDTARYEIVGTETTHTLQPGETLTKVSLKYYGTKAMWPYIVKHNQSKIKNPDNVPYGTTLDIPKLQKK